MAVAQLLGHVLRLEALPNGAVHNNILLTEFVPGQIEYERFFADVCALNVKVASNCDAHANLAHSRGKCARDRQTAYPPWRYYSAVVGSIIEATSETRFAGKPPSLACSRTIFSFGAIYTQ